MLEDPAPTAAAAMQADANPPEMRGRAPIVRAEPKTIEDHLSRAYAARYRLDGNESEDWTVVIKRLAKSGISRAAVQTMRDQKAAVGLRCVVSQVQADALTDALNEMAAG